MSYRKLKIWQRAMDITDYIYTLTDNFPKNEQYGLCSQMRRCAVSIPSNIAEGSQRTSHREFAHFILIAKGSLAELETQLLITVRRKYTPTETGNKILKELDELSRMMHSFRERLCE